MKMLIFVLLTLIAVLTLTVATHVIEAQAEQLNKMEAVCVEYDCSNK